MTELDRSGTPAHELPYRAIKYVGGQPEIVMLDSPSMIKIKAFAGYKLQKRGDDGAWANYDPDAPKAPAQEQGDGSGGEGTGGA